MNKKSKKKSVHRIVLRAPQTPIVSALMSFKTYKLPKKKFKYISL